MPDNQEIQKMDFENAFKALQDNVTQLEGENLPLEKALELFERGQLLAKRCAVLLEEAELKIRTLTTTESQNSADLEG